MKKKPQSNRKNKPFAQKKTKADISFLVNKEELARMASAHIKKPLDCLAPLRKRFGAFLIDCLPVFLLGMVTEYPGTRYEYLIVIIKFFVLIMLFIVILYLLISRGQTIGKYFMDIQMLNVKSGEVADAKKLILVRPIFVWPIFILELFPGIEFVIFLKGLFLLIWLINILFIFRKNRRCLHDWIAGTVVANCKDAYLLRGRSQETMAVFGKI
jgi:uncharacterized RDD family membrane protein YckC